MQYFIIFYLFCLHWKHLGCKVSTQQVFILPQISTTHANSLQGGLPLSQFIRHKQILNPSSGSNGSPAAAAAAKSLQSDSVRPHRRQPTRFLSPWDSPGKNAGVGCHFLLQCRRVKSESEVTQLCPTLSNPMDCSPPGSSIHGIFQAGVLEWGAIAFSVNVT